MKVLDLFSGIGGFALAMHRAGFETVAFSEVEPFPCRVLAQRFPGVPNFGNVAQIEAREVEDRFGRVDVICGGFPCQDLSVAGKRAGLGGSRSGLFWEIVRLAEGLQPTWLVLENVPGLLSSNNGRDMRGVVSALDELGYGVAWGCLDAQHFGVPQRRNRLFFVCRLGAPCPPEILFEPEGVRGDLEAGGEEGTRVAAPLTAGPGSGRNRAGRRREDDVNIVAAITADGVGTCGADDNQAQAGHLVPPLRSSPYGDHVAAEGHLVTTLTARYGKGPDSDATEPLVYACQGSNVGEFGALKSGNGHVTGGVPFVAHALTGEGFDASEDGTGRGAPIVPIQHGYHPDKGSNGLGVGRAGDPSYTLDTTGDAAVVFTERGRKEGRTFEHQNELAYALTNPASGGRTHSRQLYDGIGVRRLTPLECERLQGFPGSWTNIQGASDSARYRALGNAIAVPVVEWIARRLMDASS